MGKHVDELVLALSKEFEIYEELKRIAEEKRRVIIDGQIKELDKITKREQALAKSLVQLENLRGKIVDQLMAERGIASVATITELTQYLEADERIKLTTVKDQLGRAIQMIKKENELNGQLIEQSLKYIEFNKNLLAGLEEDSKYGSKGQDPELVQKKSLFDVKV